MFNTYSFQDVTGTFQHPSAGVASTTGAGLGSITVSMATTKTEQNVAADGKVMVSKILGENGTIVITMQQTSQLHKYLLNWYNYINTSTNTPDWANMTVTITSKNLNDKTVATGVSPQKIADRTYQAQGQMVTWTLMAAEITES